MRFHSNILNIPQYYFHMAAILKNGCHFFQQNIVRVVHLEVVQGGPLNTLIPNTCLQQPMSGGPPKRGFAPYRYTALIDVNDYLHTNVHFGYIIGALFLDLKRAFGLVNHSILLDKLEHYGIHDTELAWFSL